MPARAEKIVRPLLVLYLLGSFFSRLIFLLSDYYRLQAKNKSLDPLLVFVFLFPRATPPKVLPAWDWEFHCHEVVLCTSPWWRALMRGGFREGGRDTVDLSGLLQEGITRPEALEAVVR